MEEDPLIARADGEHATDLVVREPLHVPKYDDLALTWRQTVETSPQDRRPSRGIDAVPGLLFPAVDRVGPLSSRIETGRVDGMDSIEGHVMRLAGTDGAGAVGQDPEEPRLERRTPFETIDAPHDRHPRVLDRVLGERLGGEHRARQSGQQKLVAVHERHERLLVTFAQAPEQCGVCLHWLHSSERTDRRVSADHAGTGGPFLVIGRHSVGLGVPWVLCPLTASDRYAGRRVTVSVPLGTVLRMLTHLVKENTMKHITRLAAGAGLALGLATAVAPLAAGAQTRPGSSLAGVGADHAVFVQTDSSSGNQIVAYDRGADGSLSWAHTYDTGGLGGVLNGSVVDHLASQGSLTYDRANGLLYAVNAGSNTVSVFSAKGDHLSLVQVVDSGGTFPVSVAASGNLVYVLNALNGGSVSGFRVAGGKLHPIEGSTRSLGLVTPSDTSQFTHTPGQVTFSPDGSQVIVTTKAASNSIDVFAVGPDGRLSGAPVVNSETGTVPFAATFDPAGHLVVAEAGTNAVATFTLNPDGTAALISAVGSGQAATCWVAPSQGYLFASNAGSGSVSGYSTDASGQLTLLAPPTATDGGTVDASAAGSFLYVQTGKSGIVDEFQVSAGGSLIALGSITVPGAVGGEGIVAV